MSTAETTPDKKAGKIDLSLSQVLGGALAAMTAAALGSRLGVAGTITGAAVASIIAAIAGSLYTASLRHTREKVKTVFSGRVVPGTALGSSNGADGAAATGVPISVDVVADAPAWDLPEAPLATGRPPRRRSIPWKVVVSGALAAFALAAVTLTGLELVSGHALSGGRGTTIEQASQPRSAKKQDSKKATPSESPTSSESDTPAASESPSVTQEPKPSDEPTATEDAAPNPQQPSSEPSATAPESAQAQRPSSSDRATGAEKIRETPAE